MGGNQGQLRSDAPGGAHDNPTQRTPFPAVVCRRVGNSIWLWLIIAVAVTILSLMLAPRLARTASAQVAENVTLDEILDDPAAFYGRSVTVSGDVEDILGPRSFTIEDDDLLFDEHLLIVSARPMLDRDGQALDMNPLADRDVRVTGTVRPFVLADVERELGLDLEDVLFSGWEGRPAIVAQSIRPLPR